MNPDRTDQNSRCTKVNSRFQISFNCHINNNKNTMKMGGKAILNVQKK